MGGQAGPLGSRSGGAAEVEKGLERRQCPQRVPGTHTSVAFLHVPKTAGVVRCQGGTCHADKMSHAPEADACWLPLQSVLSIQKLAIRRAGPLLGPGPTTTLHAHDWGHGWAANRAAMNHRPSAHAAPPALSICAALQGSSWRGS